MTTLSWIYMLTVWAGITILNVYCFYKVFKKPTIESIEDQSEPPNRP